MAAEPSTPLPDIDDAADEATTLRQFLDYQRAVFVRKVDGLTTEQANRAVSPSDLSLAKLVNHLTFVEDFWANDVFAGRAPVEPWASAPWADDPDWEMTAASDHEIGELLAANAAASARADAIYDGAFSNGAISNGAISDDASSPGAFDAGALDRLAANPSGGERAHRSLRWILVHLIEEYARHLGHADYLREAIDGSTGD